ncbi:dihydrofolate reductase family protein [Kribbella solani]|uniref:2,5-diamino-6-(Ribosylamino)-4(3H)-pyrimidinone 5'-phosphate reductase n=1 Tax=Kribbella solani TaxID=236067 RepID=A0A841DLM7_9ACTN|nr:dihydrofolate reductase family protein [Kribbella solani]MBB5979442.1 2,5-diamino-6-(ribosylamino)-4(3H)-pyrimidinone 5'-phosphate reductase [Kribbella solani]
MRPHVVAQVAVSVDGVGVGFEVDVARFYALATLWQEDVTLMGADTVLAQERSLAGVARQEGPPVGAASPGAREEGGAYGRGVRAEGPLLAVVDGRGRVRSWEALRELGYWSGVLALYADQTPARPPDASTRELVTGYDQVDLTEVLEVLGRRGVRTVRVDSAGALLRACLELGLVDELALLVHPVIVGSGQRWCGGTQLELRHVGTEVFADGVLWMRYCVGA